MNQDTGEMQEKINSAQVKIENIRSIQGKVDKALAKAQRLLNVTAHVEWGVSKVMVTAQRAAEEATAEDDPGKGIMD